MNHGFQRFFRLLGFLFPVALCASCKDTEPSPSTEIAIGAPRASSSQTLSSSSVSSIQAVPPKESALPNVENVVLITVDALRADQSWSGYPHVALPNLSRLAQESTVFSRVYSVANLTTASINGMLASRYPSELNRDMCTIGRFAINDGLAVTLQRSKVQTVAAHGHAIFAGSTAPSRGFDTWSVIRGAAGRLQQAGAVTGADIAKLTLANFELSRPNQRFFSWTHFVDPHDTYVLHKEYPSTVEGERRNYDSEVAYTDALIGNLLKVIEARGMNSNTAVIIAADHGEAFGEHGFRTHGFSMYEEEIHVPLMIRLPGVPARRIDMPRSTLDIAPTIAELLGVAPQSSWKGTSLLRDVFATRPESRTIIVDVPEMLDRKSMQAVIRGNNKVTFLGTIGKAYDLATDPQERTPLAGADAEQAIEQARRDLSVIVPVAPSPCLVTASKSK